MKFPFELTKAKTPISDDLSEIPVHTEYIACFGKSKGLTALNKFSELKFLWLSEKMGSVTHASYSHLNIVALMLKLSLGYSKNG